MSRRTARRRRARSLIASVIGLALVAGLGGAAWYGWHQLTHHRLSADSCQVVGAGTGGAATTAYSMDPDQLLNASIITDVALRRELPVRAVVIALATAQQESKLRNLDYGDADSLGLFQQRPSQGWGSPAQITQPTYAAGVFYDALLKVPSWQGLPVGDAAQEVQRSAFPQAYASWEPRATALAAALTGTATDQLSCRLVHPGIASPATTPPTAAQTVSNGLASDLLITSPVVAPVGSGSGSTAITVPGVPGLAGGTGAGVVASWAIAHAAPDGIVSVVLGDQEWRPDKKGWHQAKRAAPSGHVVITVGKR